MIANLEDSLGPLGRALVALLAVDTYISAFHFRSLTMFEAIRLRDSL